jgi:hypothetical protein
LHVRVFATALLCISLTLQGCLLTRVLETRTQLCDDQPSRVVVARQSRAGLRVLFEQPTLTDRDVIWLVGHEPSQITGTDAVRELTYEAVPLQRPGDRAQGLVAKLLFHRVGGEYRLTEVAIPEKFNVLLSPPLLDAVIRVVCKAQVGVVPPTTTFDLASLDRSTLPDRDALTQLLGSPAAAIARADERSYRYCLVPCDDGRSMVASLKFSFGNRGELLRADASYFRYFLVVDLVSSKATAHIELH